MSIFVRWFDLLDQIAPELWADCFPPPLEGRWWYAALEQCGISDQFTFAYGQIEKDGRPIGIAPTFVMDVPLDVIAPDQLAALVRRVGKYVRFLRYQRTLFIGSPCSEEGTVGLLPGIAISEVIQPLQAAVDLRAKQARASMVVWKDFIDHDAVEIGKLSQLFSVASYPGTRLALAAGGFSSYLKTLKSSHRNKLKKKLRIGSQTLAVQSEMIQRPDAKTLAEIFPLFWQTYLKGKTKFEKLNLKFFELIADNPTSHFVMLRRTDDQALVAFMLCFDCGTRLVNKFIGIDYGIPDAYLYFQLWAAAVDWASLKGFAEIQSGQTGYSAKLEIGNSLVPLTNFARHRNTIVHKIFAWQAKGISWKTIDHDLAVYLAAHEEKEKS